MRNPACLVLLVMATACGFVSAGPATSANGALTNERAPTTSRPTSLPGRITIRPLAAHEGSAFARLQASNECFHALLEWPGRKVEPLKIGELMRQCLANMGGQDGDDVASLRPRGQQELGLVPKSHISRPSMRSRNATAVERANAASSCSAARCVALDSKGVVQAKQRLLGERETKPAKTGCRGVGRGPRLGRRRAAAACRKAFGCTR
jgi:hypothetical protein